MEVDNIYSLVNQAFISSKQILVYLVFFPSAEAEAAKFKIHQKHEVQLKLISFYCVQKKVMTGHQPNQNISYLDAVFVFPERAFRDLSAANTAQLQASFFPP